MELKDIQRIFGVSIGEKFDIAENDKRWSNCYFNERGNLITQDNTEYSCAIENKTIKMKKIEREKQ